MRQTKRAKMVSEEAPVMAQIIRAIMAAKMAIMPRMAETRFIWKISLLNRIGWGNDLPQAVRPADGLSFYYSVYP